MGASPRLGEGARALLGALALAILGATGITAQALTYEGSVSYSRGSYIFTEPTASFWLSNGLTLRAGRWSISATLPVILQNSGIISFVAGQPVGTGGEDAGAVGRRTQGEPVGTRDGSGRGVEGRGAEARMGPDLRQAGREPPDDSTTVFFRDSYEVEWGDPLLTASLELLSGPGTLRSIRLGLSAKVPARSVGSGVGTGAWDVGGGASAALGSRRHLLLADLWWWSYGDLPDLELEDGWMWGLSASRSFSGGRMAISATASGATAMVGTAKAPISVGMGLTRLPRQGRAFSASLSFGLTEASPDVSVSLAWSLALSG